MLSSSIRSLRQVARSQSLLRLRYASDVSKRNNTIPQQGPKNQVGVQLLSPSLHRQVFGNVSFPAPDPTFVQISRDHLAAHNLDTSQASVLPPISFDLPPLQGEHLDHHFHRIGAHVAEPHLSLSKTFASSKLPPMPDSWLPQSGWHSGWTKYHADGLYEAVDTPGEETMLCFDVETMPSYHPYAIMASAASPTAWYIWISPWLLGETDNPLQLIPLGDPKSPRIVVGHNVGYDRIRIKEEYSIQRTENRFIDTLSLHVAVRGISSPQRPGWMARRKQKREAKTAREEVIEAVRDLVEESNDGNPDLTRPTPVRSRRDIFAKEFDTLRSSDVIEDDEGETAGGRWEDITSVNSLMEVARLHCGLEVDKTIRNDLMEDDPHGVRAKLNEYITYCATDVAVTHAVFGKVLPAFLEACPSPVSWAGASLMGNSFLPVDQTWDEYIANAENKYHSLESEIRRKLEAIALETKDLMSTPERWEDDDWLGQLDWSPKAPGKSRGVSVPSRAKPKKSRRLNSELHRPERFHGAMPAWYYQILEKPFTPKSLEIVSLLLQPQWDSGRFPLYLSREQGWVFHAAAGINGLDCIPVSDLPHIPEGVFFRPGGSKLRVQSLLSAKLRKTGKIRPRYDVWDDLLRALWSGHHTEATWSQVVQLADEALNRYQNSDDPWSHQLDWSPVQFSTSEELKELEAQASAPGVVWPRWYWELTAPKKGKEAGAMDLSVRNQIAPLLLKLRWLGWPLFRSKEHGWTFRVTPTGVFKTSQTELTFTDDADAKLMADCDVGFRFYKLPHKDGDDANVGSPLAKPFTPYFENGILTSPGAEAKEALDMNAQCSYWISARDRVIKQLVLWEGQGSTRMGFPSSKVENGKFGMILPQVITMGTVTRRAIERTWLTASNAKKNRVGSELKAMIRAPPGYSIVGADVDSEELWISSLMGDAQFGMHGATALGWMTLEGQKKYGTDLHSKTAQILGVSRNEAKVFNYSRIYGAGIKHAALLLRQSNPSMLPDEAKKLAKALYASTKGKSSRRSDLFFDRSFWHGGTESFVFNKLEAIAMSERPRTPALGCTITTALQKEYLKPGFGTDFMTSRINWAVQSSGVDYLHLLIVAMEYLISAYDIKARYLISVHDELRYLVEDSDRYRCALALQVANLWTRSLFAYKLGMDNLPQGVAFFSAVDIDHVLRKEVDLPCITPSQTQPIPPGENVDIAEVLAKTNCGRLSKAGSTGRITLPNAEQLDDGYGAPRCLEHRATSAAQLQAQSTAEIEEIIMLAQKDKGVAIPRRAPRGLKPKPTKRLKTKPIVDEWDEFAEAESTTWAAVAL